MSGSHRVHHCSRAPFKRVQVARRIRVLQGPARFSGGVSWRTLPVPYGTLSRPFQSVDSGSYRLGALTERQDFRLQRTTSLQSPPCRQKCSSFLLQCRPISHALICSPLVAAANFTSSSESLTDDDFRTLSKRFRIDDLRYQIKQFASGGRVERHWVTLESASTTWLPRYGNDDGLLSPAIGIQRTATCCRQ